MNEFWRMRGRTFVRQSAGALGFVVFCHGSMMAALAHSLPSETAWRTANIGAPINTRHDEGFPAITSNGLTLYFARGEVSVENGVEHEDWDIYVSHRVKLSDAWGEPRRLPSHINTPGEEHSVSFSPDGHWLYFSSDRLDTCGGLDIFKSYRDDITDDLGWGRPQNLGCNVNTVDHDVCVIYHEEELSDSVNLYFVSNREGGSGHLDVWKIQYDPKNDLYSPAIVLPAVSSPKFDGHLDPEAGYLWSARDGGFGGSDIWHSERDSHGNWMPPTNLGPNINTQYDEQLPAPFDHGRGLYFPSDRPGGMGGLDLYISTSVSPRN